MYSSMIQDPPPTPNIMILASKYVVSLHSAFPHVSAATDVTGQRAVFVFFSQQANGFASHLNMRQPRKSVLRALEMILYRVLDMPQTAGDAMQPPITRHGQSSMWV